MFIYFWDRERQSMNGGGSEREGDTEAEAGSELSAQNLTRGSNSQTMRSWPEPNSKAQPTEPPRCSSSSSFLKFTYLCLRKRESRGGAEREGERGSQAGSLLPAQSPTQGLSPTHCKIIMTWAEIKSWMLKQLSHPGAPGVSFSIRQKSTATLSTSE